MSLRLRRGVPDPRGVMRLARILRGRRPDILQTWLYHADLLGLLAFRLAGDAALLWNLRCSESVGAGLVRSVLCRFSAVPERVLVNSRYGQRYHERLGYRPRRWEYIPNGIDADRFLPDQEMQKPVRLSLGIGEEAKVIGHMARFHAMKDYPTLLAAAGQLAARDPRVVFILVGNGIEPSNRELMRLVDRNGLVSRTLLLGERADVDLLYRAFDIATSSSDFGEGFSNVLAEAMSCGVPCVATDSGDSAEIIGRTGEIVRTGDAAALAAAWERLLALPPEARRALGAAARERVMANYGIGAIVRRYETLYEEIAAERLSRRHRARAAF